MRGTGGGYSRMSSPSAPITNQLSPRPCPLTSPGAESLGEVVERVDAEDDLVAGAVGARGGREFGLIEALSDDDLLATEERRPSRCAVVVAGRLTGRLVGDEAVQGHAFRVDDDLAKVAVAELNVARASRRRRRRIGRGGCRGCRGRDCRCLGGGAARACHERDREHAQSKESRSHLCTSRLRNTPNQ